MRQSIQRNCHKHAIKPHIKRIMQCKKLGFSVTTQDRRKFFKFSEAFAPILGTV